MRESQESGGRELKMNRDTERGTEMQGEADAERQGYGDRNLERQT